MRKGIGAQQGTPAERRRENQEGGGGPSMWKTCREYRVKDRGGEG